MLVTGLVALALTAAPIRVAVTRFNFVGASEARTEFYTEHFADLLSEQGLEVTSPREVAAVLGVERERQLLGCGDNNCIAELTAALGVEAIASGDLVRVGENFQLSVKMLAANSGRRLTTFSAKASSEEALLVELQRAAEQLSRGLSEALGRPYAPRVKASAGARRWWWLPGLFAVAGAAGAAVGFGLADGARAQLATEPSLGLSNAQLLLESGQRARALGWVSAGVGLAALGVTLGLLAFGGDAMVKPAVTLSPAGASLSLVGVLP